MEGRLTDSVAGSENNRSEGSFSDVEFDESRSDRVGRVVNNLDSLADLEE